ncbi:MAG TPA: sulfotransferase [Methylomirabilota bacterium]|jgi:hypothetical protein|nr:sulfotransferase [Methylomirabilota bacterium]
MADPLIILSPPHSFTSVAAAMLGQHPQLYAFPEVNLFVAETMRERAGVLKRWAFSEHGLLRLVAELWEGEQNPRTIALARRWIESRLDHACVSVLRELAERVEPRGVVEKSPMTVLNAEAMQRARRAFPGARFLHLVRHPRTQGASLLRVGGAGAAQRLGGLDYSTPTPTMDPQKAWYTLHMNICTFLDTVPKEQQCRLQGEELLADPDVHLARLAQWLGLRADAEALEEMKHPERSPYAAFGPLTARFGSGSRFLREPTLRAHAAEPQASLKGPLAWRPDGVGFSSEVIQLAAEFGYR